MTSIPERQVPSLATTPAAIPAAIPAIPADIIPRREAVRRVAALLGGAVLVGGSNLLIGCAPDRAPSPLPEAGQPLAPIGDFSVADQQLLAELADTVLPDTDTPGAKAAGVGPFIAVMVTDCYTPEDQEIVRTGFQALDATCQAQHGVSFVEASADQRLTMVQALDAEQHTYMRERERGAPTHWFRMIKELTLFGYFTSEVGATQALRYVEAPGRFDPCTPYTPGDRIWASHA